MHAFSMSQHQAGHENARVRAFPCVMAVASWSRVTDSAAYLTIDTKPEPRRSSTSP
jgi:hypothetical protein